MCVNVNRRAGRQQRSCRSVGCPAVRQSERSALQIVDSVSHEITWADRRQRSLTGDRRSISKGERQRQSILFSLATLLVSQSILDLTVG
jgi:hypothetical protein